MSSTTAEVGAAGVEDGRRARRERNREAVVDAMLGLFGDGNLAPSADEIAERAGLSPRSLFRYFDDVDDLTRTAIARQLERVVPLVDLDVAPDAPVDVKVTALVEQRLRLFDAIGSVGQVSRLRAPFQPLIATQLSQTRSFLRRQVKRLLAAELERLGPQRAASTLAAIDVLCSFEAYRLLRDDQSLGRARTAAVLIDNLTRLLAPEAP